MTSYYKEHMKERPYKKIRQLEENIKELHRELYVANEYKSLAKEFYDTLCSCVGKNTSPNVEFWIARFKRLLK